MKLEINGIKREVQIMQAPQGSFYCDKDLWLPQFPIYIGMCEPMTKDEGNYGNVIIFPIYGGYNGGYECIEPQWVMYYVRLVVLHKLIPKYAFENECDHLKEAVEGLMDLFEIHKTPITLSVREYVNDVMNGTITKMPTNG